MPAMAKDKTLFACSVCGGTSPKWLGKCPHCEAWNTLVETAAPTAGAGKNRFEALARSAPVTRLADIEAQDVQRTPTGQEELDRVLGIAAQTSFRDVAILPVILLFVFAGIWFYDRSKGGYKATKI